MIKILKDDYSTRLLCETLGVHRCNLYHQPRPDEDRPIKDAPVHALVELDREYVSQQRDEPWERYYARSLVERFGQPA